MNYVSVWSKNNKRNTFKERRQYNQWIPFTNNQNNTICIGRNEDDYQAVRAMIGYYKNNISVFNLNTFQFIKHDGHAIIVLYQNLKMDKKKILK
ncbi:hypothetical protein RFI_36671 [Reticulomyxa filosa]|uniref:Uncharacterized protein n=1 Tax=Reticulomyxa filosa TaxID=46433 RepID=X6LGP9_RETFI|nr:hypothetical protein RFI_36671 [Reticulomyxa filosa]|eukprot:ETO00769.1 hypothetical protein RFI_36671 [Reticulomyxa filosa]